MHNKVPIYLINFQKCNLPHSYLQQLCMTFPIRDPNYSQPHIAILLLWSHQATIIKTEQSHLQELYRSYDPWCIIETRRKFFQVSNIEIYFLFKGIYFSDISFIETLLIIPTSCTFSHNCENSHTKISSKAIMKGCAYLPMRSGLLVYFLFFHMPSQQQPIIP